MTTKKAIHGLDVSVSVIGRIELADNIKLHDANMSIQLAHGDDDSVYLVLCTNGDDTAIGWIDDDGDIEIAPEVEEDWFDDFPGRDDYDYAKEWLEAISLQAREGKVYS